MTQANLPPPIPYPPPMMPIVMPAQRGGFGRALLTTLAVSIFGLSLTFNLWALAYLVFSSSDGIDRSTITSGSSKTVVAVLPLDTEISAESAEGFLKLLRVASEDSSVKAIVVEVDTPGGTVGASERIYAELQKVRKDRGLPVVVSMGDMATSGGYFIACAADNIVAQRTTWTGNIGVLLPRVSVAKLAEKYGVEDQTIVSNGAPFKNAGSPLKDDTAQQTAYWQGLADEAFVVFKEVIVKGRNLTPAQVDVLANGRVYTGEAALKLKLIDQLGTRDDAVATAASRAGLSNPQVVRMSYHQWGGISSLLGAKQDHSLVEADFGGAHVKLSEAAASRYFRRQPLYLFGGR